MFKRSSPDSLERYRDLPILSGLRGRELRELERCGRVVRIQENWSIIHQHESPDNAYLLLEGRARVDAGGTRLTELGPGDLAGEMGVVSRRPRTASVTALEPTIALVFPAADFTAVREAAPTFAGRVDAIVEKRRQPARSDDQVAQDAADEPRQQPEQQGQGRDEAGDPPEGRDGQDGHEIDTVVLDVDGTLVDTVYQHTMAWAGAFAAAGVSVPLWRLHRAVGMGGDRLPTEVAGQGVEDAHGDRIRKEHDRLFEDSLDSVQALPGAADLLVELHRRGFKVVLASSGVQEQTEQLLDLVGAPADSWDEMATSADVQATKPAPDLVEVAIEAVGGRRAAVIGDAVWDIEAARDQGRYAIGLLSGGFGEAELRDAGAAEVYPSARELVDGLDDTPLRGRRPAD